MKYGSININLTISKYVNGSLCTEIATNHNVFQIINIILNISYILTRSRSRRYASKYLSWGHIKLEKTIWSKIYEWQSSNCRSFSFSRNQSISSKFFTVFHSLFNLFSRVVFTLFYHFLFYILVRLLTFWITYIFSNRIIVNRLFILLFK